MKITKFLNIDIEPAPPELELEIEMQCREIMKAEDLVDIKRYCTHLVRKKFDQDISLLNNIDDQRNNFHIVVVPIDSFVLLEYLRSDVLIYTYNLYKNFDNRNLIFSNLKTIYLQMFFGLFYTIIFFI